MKRAIIVFIFGLLSILILLSLITLIFYTHEQNLFSTVISSLRESAKNNGFWTLLTVIISSPVAFAIWYFRDQNTTQQIENARKDTNLKEFQKIAEWVSGAHLIEDKFIEKTSRIDNQKKELEITQEYTDIPCGLSIPTYSKKDGAVGLQIAAIYNLLPFYRGEHGESFKKPALNLLTSAWLAMQQRDIEALEATKSTNHLKNKSIKNIRNNASSPIGSAITRVLLSLNNKGEICLLEHREFFPASCLVGINFNRVGVDRKILENIFNNLDCRGVDFTGAKLKKVHFYNAKLRNANFTKADLLKADFSKANLDKVNFTGADLEKTNFTDAKSIETADFTGAKNLDKAIGLPLEIIEKYSTPSEN
ncbi:pentapeptide repeat-containing protein [Otariodibacter sp.]|uniref:pentapeptide repeat-containing protein n=1 Tax=Otariodibacter sp. TaxID=3030919 RepID=UPI002629C347|nr:pentapeptide repeat-containing protein [Otariodibacter sp.]